MSIKSKIAFEFSVERYFQGEQFARLWTFTLVDVLNVQEFRPCWNNLQHALRRIGFHGIRVYELHPGGHGLHVHLVTKGWFDVDVVRPLAQRYGWGRVHVKEIPASEAAYIGKYLGKQTRENAIKGMRLWSGLVWKCNKVRDIVNDGTVARMFKHFSDHLMCQYVRDFDKCGKFAKFMKKSQFIHRLVLLGDWWNENIAGGVVWSEKESNYAVICECENLQHGSSENQVLRCEDESEGRERYCQLDLAY